MTRRIKKTLSLIVLMFFAMCLQSQVLFEQHAISLGLEYVATSRSGISFCDFDDDGWDDITVPSNTGEAVRFFKNVEGSFEEIFFDIVDPLYRTRQVVWIDFDNDGDKDLFVTSQFEFNALYENDNFVFTNITASAGLPLDIIATDGGSWGDYDNDGDLDLFLANRDPFFLTPNMLYRNNGDKTFTNVNIASGIGNHSTLCFQGTFFDYNNDGFLDLYLINDRTITANILYRNNGDSTFADVSESSGTNYVMDAMSVALEDYNSDGYTDVYISNIYDVNRVILGNVLMENNGDGTFTNRAMETGTQFFDFSWGASWLDGDNDGKLDLYVSGSNNENILENNSAAFFYQNEDDFSIISDSGFENDLAFSFGNATGDFNNDGFSDIIVLNQAPYNSFVFENRTSEISSNNWLRVKLQGVESNRDAYGAKIEIGTSLGVQYRYRASIESFLSQNSDTEVFGLNSATNIDYIKVTWPSGQEDLFEDIAVNDTLLLIEGEELLRTAPELALIELEFFPNPVYDMLTVQLPLTETRGVLSLYDVLGNKLKSEELSATTTQISLQTLPTGMYLAVYTSDTTSTTKKIMKL
ncbi:FG-GAP-like repeat-containing protein [Patiriisocius sp. Uisw_017]|jgi:hypothetical protein|uniref:FG-GAP-like repeat-containing protein n=1 Tax=Patiriisocius sp. Uisw_017 TaxID=3230968 RepID=UPI0039E7E8E7